MKKSWVIGIVVLLAVGQGGASPAAAQGELDRLESGIRTSNGQPVTMVASVQRVYLGAVADDSAGRGVWLLSVRSGGPADRAGLQAQDLIVAAAGRKIRLLGEFSAILNGLNPGDRLSLELVRGNRPLRTEVVLGALPGTVQSGTPPPTGLGAGRTESIPPPPGEVASPPSLMPAPSSEGPAFSVPNRQPFPPKSSQAQIEELRRRVDQLERRIAELERALAESRQK
ncbi:MAG: PDZ domain-containing protein [Planctomycetota bacterium]